MKANIIDTNVLIVANGLNTEANDIDIEKCQNVLTAIRLDINEVISIDWIGDIFTEYFNNVKRSGQPGFGDQFAKWLWDNQGIEEKVELVKIVTRIEDQDKWQDFDKSDIKFVNVALNTSFPPATIYYATDSDWRPKRQELANMGIQLNEICPDLIKPL
jgi:hypothetical protein